MIEKPEFPEPKTLVRYLYHEWDDKICSFCKSSLKIKFGFPFTLAFSVRHKGCVQPKCKNYYKKHPTEK